MAVATLEPRSLAAALKAVSGRSSATLTTALPISAILVSYRQKPVILDGQFVFYTLKSF
jgi:hypothetical protein